jgi:hypothetical protein
MVQIDQEQGNQGKFVVGVLKYTEVREYSCIADPRKDIKYG